MVENRNCYSVKNEPKSWLIMVLEELNKTMAKIIKTEVFAS